MKGWVLAFFNVRIEECLGFSLYRKHTHHTDRYKMQTQTIIQHRKVHFINTDNKALLKNSYKETVQN